MLSSTLKLNEHEWCDARPTLESRRFDWFGPKLPSDVCTAWMLAVALQFELVVLHTSGFHFHLYTGDGDDFDCVDTNKDGILNALQQPWMASTSSMLLRTGTVRAGYRTHTSLVGRCKLDF